MAVLTEKDLIKDFNSKKVSIRLNDSLNGVEIKFNERDFAISENSKIKSAGFRWSGRQQLWYAKQNDVTLDYALNLRELVLDEIEKDGEKTYSAAEFNAEIEKELEKEITKTEPKKLQFEVIETQKIPDEIVLTDSDNPSMEELLLRLQQLEKQNQELLKQNEELKNNQEVSSDFEELKPSVYVELFNNNVSHNVIKMDEQSAKAVLDSCREDFGIKLYKGNRIVSVNGTYPSLQDISPIELLRASVIAREEKSSINNNPQVEAIWNSLGTIPSDEKPVDVEQKLDNSEKVSDFDPMDFIGSFDEISLDNNSFHDYIVNGDNKAVLHSIENEEVDYESTESEDGKTSQSQDGREADLPTGRGYDLGERNERNSPSVGGNPGRGYTREGYRNSVLNESEKESGINGRESSSSNDNSISNGQIWESSPQQDSNGSSGILQEHLQEGGLGNNMGEPNGSALTTEHGTGILNEQSSELSIDVITSKAQMKSIREQCKEIIKKPLEKITEEEKRLLMQYEGGGGLKEQNATSYETLNAFYTPRNVIEKVWELVDYYSPNAVTVLEPTCGIGRFAENRPNNKFTLREYDETSSKIAKILHPEAEVIQGAFQEQFFDENGIYHLTDYKLPKYDVVVGNPPYGVYSGEWKGKGEGKEFDRYEEYFIARGLESLKDENSVMIFVIPSGFLNTLSDSQKEIIAQKGKLIDAYRLPVGTFPTTEVGTDIIVMRNWDRDRLIIKEAGGTEEYQQKQLDALFEENLYSLSKNQFFIKNPEKVLGEIKVRSNRFGKEEVYVDVHEGLTVQDELNKITSFIPQQSFDSSIAPNTNSEQEENIIQKHAESYNLPLESYKSYVEQIKTTCLEHGIESISSDSDISVLRIINKEYPSLVSHFEDIVYKLNESVNPEHKYGIGNSPYSVLNMVNTMFSDSLGFENNIEKQNLEFADSLPVPENEHPELLSTTIVLNPETVSFSSKEIEQKAVSEKSFIQKSFERLSENTDTSPLLNSRTLSVILDEKEVPVQDIVLQKIEDRTFRQMHDGGIPWTYSIIVDLSSQTAVLCKNDYDNVSVVAETDKDGTLLLHYDRLSDDYTNLTKAKKDNLESCVIRFKTDVNDFFEQYLGSNNNYHYFRDTGFESYENRFLRQTTFFDTSKMERISFNHSNLKISAIGLKSTESYIAENLEEHGFESVADRGFSYGYYRRWGNGIPFYATFDTLYSSEKPDLSKIDEEDSFIKMSVEDKLEELRESLQNLSWDEKRDVRKEIIALPVNECLKMSKFSTVDEYVSKIKDYYKQERENKLAAFEQKRDIIQTEQEWNPKFEKLLEMNFELNKEIHLTQTSEVAVCVHDSKNQSQINVLINEEPAFSINDNTHTITAYNNLPVTKEFLSKLKERWNGQLNWSISEVKPEILSLDKMLEIKPVSKAQEFFAKSLSDFVLSKENYAEKEGKVLKSLDINGTNVTAQKSGTIIKVFFDKNKYTALEYNTKTNYLVLNQETYDKNLILPLKESFKSLVSNVYINTDVIIDGKRYVDENGRTFIAPPKAARYNPEAEEILDNAGFAKKYGKNWNPEERVFWEATDYKGYVDLSKLNDEQIQSLKSDENYVTEENGKIIHKELFASGNIYAKIQQNEENWNNGKLNDSDYDRNKKILENAKPELITLDKISVSVISPFAESVEIDGVPLKDKFMQWATGCNIEDSPNSYDSISDFSLAQVTRDDIPPTISWSDVKGYVFNEELERVKNADDDDEKAQIRNQKKNDRKETAEKLFDRFIHNGLTKEESELFVEKYNKTFNHEKAPDYSKLPLFVDGMNQFRKNQTFKLYEQQIKGISFLCNKGNGLLAYDVGLGKTAAGIVATVQQIQSGRCRKPVIVVPKSVIGKWESDIHELFPDIQVNNLGNFSKEQVGVYYDGNHGLNIPQGSITLITKDALNNICFGKKVIDEYLFNDYADLLAYNDKLKDDNPTVRASTKEAIYREAGIAEQVSSMYYIQWDKTGFDHITVDEAHAYKNLFKIPRAKKGESSEFSEMGTGKPSKRALKMFNMTQIIQQQNENRNVFMLTATPFTNSALEVYSMLSYIARKELEQNGIKDLNSFCKQYAMTRFEKAVTKGGKDIKYKNVMKSFNDLPGLQNILKQYIDKVDGEEQEQQSIDFRHSFVRPIKETHTVFLETTPLQEEIFNFAVRVMDYTPTEDDIQKRVEQGKKGVAPVLEAMNLMRTACLSPSLIDSKKLSDLLEMVDTEQEFSSILSELPSKDEVVTCSPKLKLVCDTVISNWKAHKDCGQVIYMPEGTDSYSKIIDYMVNKGVPKNVFATIDGSSCKIGGKNVTAKMLTQYTDASDDNDEDIASDKRAFVAEKFNNKKDPCKILIGSSAISEGMDLNGNSIAVYNCMLGWNPTEDVQVEGRIWRQGNEQGRVHIVYPLVYDSIDSLLYQKHSEKQSRINALFDYKDASTLNVEDINPEELKYELIKDPFIRAKLEISDKAVEYKKQLVLLDNQLKDYDQLIKSRMKYSEKLAEREANKANYISNYQNSLALGEERRTAEEQEEGIKRFDKSIEDCKKQIENVKRRFAEMKVVTSEDEHNFAAKILEQKKLVQQDMDKLYDQSYQATVIEKYKKLLSEEKISRIEKEITEPLDKTIQSQMKPMHEVEHEKKYAKYQRFIEIAKSENNSELIKTLDENWNEYEEYYQEKYGQKKPGTDDVVVAVRKTTIVEPKKEPQSDSIIKIIRHEVETIDFEKINTTSDGSLFDVPEPTPEEKAIERRTEQRYDKISVDNFAENLQAILKDIKFNKENVLKAVNKLVNKMDSQEKERFSKVSAELNINSAAKANEFFEKMAKGEIKFTPNKKPPVTQNTGYEDENILSF